MQISHAMHHLMPCIISCHASSHAMHHLMPCIVPCHASSHSMHRPIPCIISCHASSHAMQHAMPWHATHQEASLCEVAAEVVGEMASRHESLLPAITPRLLSSFSQAAATHPDAFPPLASPPPNATAALPTSQLSSASGKSSVDEEERERLVAAFASAIADVGLAGPAQMLLSPHLRDPFATAALRCASFRSSDHRIAISLLPLWSGWSEFVSSRLSPSSPSSPALSPQDGAAVQAILLAALPLCLSHAKLRTASPGSRMTRAQQEEEEEDEDEAEAAAEDYREQLEETLVDVMRAVGAANFLSCSAPILLASPPPQPHQLLADAPALELQLFASQAVGQVADSDRPEDVAWACQVLTAVAAVAAAVATASQSAVPPRLQPWVHRAVAANALAYLSFLPRVPPIVPALLQSLSQGLLPPTSQQAGPAGATPTPATGGCGRGERVAYEPIAFVCAAALCALCEAHNSDDSPPAAAAAAAASASVNEGLAAQLVAVGESLFLRPSGSPTTPLFPLPLPSTYTSSLHLFPPPPPSTSSLDLLPPPPLSTSSLHLLSRPLPSTSSPHPVQSLHLARLQPKQEADVITAVASAVSSLPPSHLLLALQRLLQPILATLHAFSAFLLPLPSSSSSPTLDRDALTTAVAAAAHCLAPLATLSGPSFLPCTDSALTSLQSAFSASGPPPAPLSLSACPPILRTTETLLSLQPQPPTSTDQLQLSTARATSALMSFVSAPASVALKGPKGAEQQPELTEALLHFATFLLGHVPPTLLASDPSSPVLPPLSHLLQVAAPGCTAAHRGVSASSFAFISALMTAAIQQAGALSLQAHSQSQPQAQQGVGLPPLVQLCTAHGTLLSHTPVAALLGPSAVSRVHKCVSLLQQLFHVCCCAARAGGSPQPQGSMPGSAEAEAAAAAAAVQAALAPMHQWLVAALSALPPGFLRAGEAEAVLPAWLTQLASSRPPLAGSSSEVEWGNTRMLRRLLRSFADSHRHTAVGA
ncbi:unnamed protein product [Closterium sp. Yama58-4]|nr:unnamed protein product [Closterium sp. Yama58-4]